MQGFGQSSPTGQRAAVSKDYWERGRVARVPISLSDGTVLGPLSEWWHVVGVSMRASGFGERTSGPSPT
jgi:hypothetical protein